MTILSDFLSLFYFYTFLSFYFFFFFSFFVVFFFLNDTAPTEISPLSLHDALPISMLARGKGLLAADESSGTCEKRFKSVGVESTEANRRTYRDLLFSTKGIEEFESGVILLDRKSTRLNSSHTVISYAVFCLKKKRF